MRVIFSRDHPTSPLLFHTIICCKSPNKRARMTLLPSVAPKCIASMAYLRRQESPWFKFTIPVHLHLDYIGDMYAFVTGRDCHIRGQTSCTLLLEPQRRVIRVQSITRLHSLLGTNKVVEHGWPVMVRIRRHTTKGPRTCVQAVDSLTVSC